MKHDYLFSQRFAVFYVLSTLAFIFSPNDKLLASLMADNSEAGSPFQKVELSYTFPDEVNAGDMFEFTISLKKDKTYQLPGSITCLWYEGLKPNKSVMEGANFSVVDNTATIRWEKLSDSNIISFSYQVKSNENLKGVYPVKINFKDNNDYRINNSIGIFVVNNVEEARPNQNIPAQENPFSISLQYPDEVLLAGDYDLNISIAKGKNTGSVKIFVQLPPDCSFEIQGQSDYRFDSQTGEMSLNLKSMPASPEFSIACKVKSTHTTQAVYPIRASAEFEDGTKVYYDNYILVTDKLTESRQSSWLAKNAEAETEANNKFLELEQLLHAWTLSTTGKNAEQISNENKTYDGDAQQSAATPDDVSVAAFETNREDYEDKAIENVTSESAITENAAVPELSTESYYSVQIAASLVQMDDLKKFLQSMRIQEIMHENYDGTYYRYDVGEFQDKEAAKSMLEHLTGIGFPDAFVVKYENGKRK